MSASSAGVPVPETPFFPPLPPRITDFGTELFAEENSALLLPGHTTKAESLGQVINNPSVPILAFTAALYQEIRYLAMSIPTEWAVFLLLKKLSPAQPHFLAFDWFMTLQTASSGEVTMDAEDARRYYRALEDLDYYREHGLHRHLCHLHSHAKLDVFFSQTDHNQQTKRDELGFCDDYRFYAVVNAAGGIKVSFVTYSPVLGQFDAAPALLFSNPEYVGALTAERKREIDARVAALVRAREWRQAPEAGRDWVDRRSVQAVQGDIALREPESDRLLSSEQGRAALFGYLTDFARASSPDAEFFPEEPEDDGALGWGVDIMAGHLHADAAEADTLHEMLQTIAPPRAWNDVNREHWTNLAGLLDLVAALHENGADRISGEMRAAVRIYRREFSELLHAALRESAYDDSSLYAEIEKAFSTAVSRFQIPGGRKTGGKKTMAAF